MTETGWGEFDIIIKIFFVPEAFEKPITFTHHLKLHPWPLDPTLSLAPPPLFTPKIKVPITTTRPVSVPVANPKASKFSLILDVKVVSPLKSHPGAPVPTKSL